MASILPAGIANGVSSNYYFLQYQLGGLQTVPSDAGVDFFLHYYTKVRMLYAK